MAALVGPWRARGRLPGAGRSWAKLETEAGGVEVAAVAVVSGGRWSALCALCGGGGAGAAEKVEKACLCTPASLPRSRVGRAACARLAALYRTASLRQARRASSGVAACAAKAAASAALAVQWRRRGGCGGEEAVPAAKADDAAAPVARCNSGALRCKRLRGARGAPGSSGGSTRGSGQGKSSDGGGGCGTCEAWTSSSGSGEDCGGGGGGGGGGAQAAESGLALGLARPLSGAGAAEVHRRASGRPLAEVVRGRVGGFAHCYTSAFCVTRTAIIVLLFACFGSEPLATPPTPPLCTPIKYMP